MNQLQLLTFEISNKCPLSTVHAACPCGKPERYARLQTDRPTADEEILDVAHESHALGFTGKIAWHYYCEPLLELDRIRRLTRAIRDETPLAEFLLWTNGVLIGDDPEPLAGLFNTIIVSDYVGRSWDFLRAVCHDVRVVSGNLDWRMAPPSLGGTAPCRRPYVELAVDYWGNVCPCCFDWQGELCLGNVHDTPWAHLVNRYRGLRRRVDVPAMADDAPPRCLHCGTRQLNLPNYASRVASG